MSSNRDPSRFPGPTWDSTHEYGACLVNRARKLYYIEIPKCASSWARAYLDQVGTTNHPFSDWENSNFTVENLDGYQPIIFLRNPIDRWISADPIQHKILDFSRAEIHRFLEDLMHYGSTDEHVCPQSDFLQGVNLTGAWLFRVDLQLSTHFYNFLEIKEFDPSNMPEYVNTRYQGRVEQMREKAWRKIFKNPEWFWMFQQYYEQDYQLLKQIRFSIV